jgi:hypothetical protein
MEGFKTLAKGVKCFKAGGSVYKSRHSEKSEQKSDMAQDKKVVKKAFAMHDKQEHPGEKTDLSKLKKGGRSKKAVGTVKKFKCGGGVFGAKKTKEDIKNMDAAKTCKPKKLAIGGQPGASEAQQKFYDKNKAEAKVKEDKALYEAVGSRGDAARKGMSEGRMDPMGTAYKKGGKIKKCADGGRFNSIDDDVRARAMKFIESGSPENTETAETPVAPAKPAKPARRAKAVKLPMPDYSNEDLDKMDAQIAEKTRRSKRTPRQMLEEESEYTIKPSLQTKGERLMKSFGMKRGGKAKKMNTGGTCS